MFVQCARSSASSQIARRHHCTARRLRLVEAICALLCCLAASICATDGRGVEPTGGGPEVSPAVRPIRDDVYPQQTVRMFGTKDGLPAGPVEQLSCDLAGTMMARLANGTYVWNGRRWQPADRSMPAAASGVEHSLLPRPLPWEPVTVARRAPHGSWWIGTPQGAAFWTGTRWHAVHSRRWLVGDHVHDLCFDPQGDIWIATDAGVSVIHRRSMTLAQKAEQILDRLRQRHVWRGLVRQSHFPEPGNMARYDLPPADNDGLWTALYVAAESFRHAATKSPQARRWATESMNALLFLESVTGTPGFLARSFVPAGEAAHLSGHWHRSADGLWDWKSDTSSDELVGHVFAWSIYWDLVAEGEQRQRVAATVRNVVERIIDHGYYWVDPDGQRTTWGVWAPRELNRNVKWIAERGLNSLECLALLKTAYHITGEQRFEQEYRRLAFEESYAMNTVRQKIIWPPQEVNHSDDELAFLSYYPLLKYERDPQLQRIYQLSIRRSWAIERPEHSSLFNFIFGSTGQVEFDLPASVEYLRDVPLDMFDWPVRNDTRRDIAHAGHPNRAGQPIGTRALLPSERAVMRWNGDPYTLSGGGRGNSEDDGTFFLLPYWMGRYHRFLTP